MADQVEAPAGEVPQKHLDAAGRNLLHGRFVGPIGRVAEEFEAEDRPIDVEPPKERSPLGHRAEHRRHHDERRPAAIFTGRRVGDPRQDHARRLAPLATERVGELADRRPLEQHVQAGRAAKRLFGAHQHRGGEDRMTAEVEEVVIDADARAVQHVGPQRDERGFDGIALEGQQHRARCDRLPGVEARADRPCRSVRAARP